MKTLCTLFTFMLLLFCACQNPQKTLKIAATSIPHAEMLAAIKSDLAYDGISLEIIEVDDYNIPNRALVDKEVDANFFQHSPYLASQIQMFSYPITALTNVHIEPMGIYSEKIKTLQELNDTSTILLPNDPINEARAVALLHKSGIIELDDPENLQASIFNIIENPKHITFVKTDAPLLPEMLKDVDAAVIPAKIALLNNLKPALDALTLEDETSHFTTVIAIRKNNENKKELIALKKHMTSQKMRHHIQDKYKGDMVCAF